MTLMDMIRMTMMVVIVMMIWMVIMLILTKSSEINIAPDIKNRPRSIDLFKSMIIKNNRSKVRYDPPAPTVL